MRGKRPRLACVVLYVTILSVATRRTRASGARYRQNDGGITSSTIDNLVEVSRSGNSRAAADASLELGEYFEFGKLEHLNDHVAASQQEREERAVWHYNQSSQLGNVEAMFTMATLQSTALLGVDRNTAAAIAKYHFAAIGGHPGAQRAMGYRYLYGVGVPKDCELAVTYYELAANAVMRERDPFLSSRLQPIDRLHDQALGAERKEQKRQKRSDLVEYYSSLADGGNINALLKLGFYHLYGPPLGESEVSVAEQNFTKARMFFEATLDHQDSVSDSTRASATLALAHIHFHGYDVEANATRAYELWMDVLQRNYDERGEVHNSLGILYLDGLTPQTPKNVQKAKGLFKKAAERGNAKALYNLGLLHLRGVGEARSFPKAAQYVSLAAQRGLVLATHKLAQMKLRGIDGAGRAAVGGGSNAAARSKCESSASLFKSVAEKDAWLQWLVHEAYRRYSAGDLSSAVSLYSRAAEQGIVEAQMNAAWILRKMNNAVRGSNEENAESGVRRRQREVRRLYARAAAQGRVRAKLELGDWYYYHRNDEIEGDVGVGHKSLRRSSSIRRSVSYYRSAALHRSAQAMFNMGVFYQFGIGVSQDLHLAKRFYDQSVETDPRAYVPSTLALLGLRIHRMWKDPIDCIATVAINWLLDLDATEEADEDRGL